MAKKQGFLGDLSDLMRDTFALLPWWVSIAFSLFVTAIVYPVTPEGMEYLAFVAGAFFLISGIRGYFLKRQRRLLFDKNQDLESIRALDWRKFEELVAEAYRRKGYGATVTGGGGADGGIDVKLTRGSETVLVQCKHWKTYTVDVKKARELVGVVTAARATRGILITSGRFTAAAKTFAATTDLELVDGEGLIELMKVAKAPGIAAPVAAPDPVPPTPEPAADPAAEPALAPVSVPTDAPNCPTCDSTMVQRTARKGARAGESFWGCTRYPSCRGTRPLAAQLEPQSGPSMSER